MLQRAAAGFGLPASLHESAGELASKRCVSDGDDQSVLRGKLLYPGRCVADAGRFCRRRVLPTQRQEERPPTDGKGPGRKRKAKPPECGAPQIELAQQRRDDYLAPSRQQTRRGKGPGNVTRDHDVRTSCQLLEMGRSTLVVADAGGFIGLTPRAEATRRDPAGVDVRGAGMTNKDDATL
jgi:hypothetical protein